jgi:hypothetical protein
LPEAEIVSKMRDMSRNVPWKSLAADLKAHGIDSQYIARVEARVTREQQQRDLEKEMAQEIAGALGRSDMRVNLALAELELHKARYDQAQRQTASATELASLAAAYNAQRLEAKARLRDLLIHREAVGFRRNQILNELYPIPPKLEG